MTDRAKAGRLASRRLSKRMLRAWAWVAGALAFFSSWAVLGAHPKPATAATERQPPRRVIIVRKITRRVVIHEAPAPQPVQYVYAPSSSSGSGGSGPSGPPTTSTGGS